MRRLLTVAAATAAVLAAASAPAFADDGPTTNTNGASLINLQDVLNNNNIGICDNNVNALGVQVPVDAAGLEAVLNLLTVGSPMDANNTTPSACASQNSNTGASS